MDEYLAALSDDCPRAEANQGPDRGERGSKQKIDIATYELETQGAPVKLIVSQCNALTLYNGVGQPPAVARRLPSATDERET